MLFFYANNGQSRQFFTANSDGLQQLTAIPNGTGCIVEDENRWPIIISDATYFSVADANCSLRQVWRTDGRPATTRLAHEFPYGFLSIHPTDVGFYAVAGDSPSSLGIWYSSGTGAQLVQGGFDSISTVIYPASEMGFDFYFLVQRTGDPRYELWRAGTNGATMLGKIALETLLAAEGHEDYVYISGSNGEVWRITEGEDAPVLWQDGSQFRGVVADMHSLGDELFLIDQDRSRPLIETTETLWRYVGPADKLEEIVTYSNIQAITKMAGEVFFAAEQWADPPLEGSVLLRLSQSATTPEPVSPEFALTGDKSIDLIVTDYDFVYMRVYTSEGIELWVSDGSAAGTQRVTSLTTRSGESQACPCLAATNKTLYFDFEDPATGVELWELELIKDSLYVPYISRN
jgi:ELWxxDGT repeat protein